MVAISLSVRALLLTVVTFAHFMKIERPVEDYARIFTVSEEDVIAKRINSLRNRTDVQMAVLTVQTLGGQKIEVFSRRAAQAWGGGRRDKDDGLLLVIAPKEHRIRLEVGAGLTSKLPADRVKTILDDAAPQLKMQSYKTAVLDIIEALDPPLRGRGALLSPSRTSTAVAVGAGAVVGAAAMKAAKSGSRSQPTSSTSTQPDPRTAPTNVNPMPIAPQFADQAALDSFLMKQFFLLLSFMSLVLGMVFGRSRLRQEPSSFTGFFSYVAMIVIALGVSWFASVSLGSPGISTAVLVVTLVQAFSGMRAAMASHLKRVTGPDNDFELIEQAPLREVARYVVPGIGVTLLVGLALHLPGVHGEQFIAIVGTAIIGVIHAVGLNRLDEALVGRPVLPPGSYTRICTSSLGRLNDQGEHVHARDDTQTTTYQTDDNNTDNRGEGGKFNGDGASSQW